MDPADNTSTTTTLINDCELIPCADSSVFKPKNFPSHKAVTGFLPLDIEQLISCNCLSEKCPNEVIIKETAVPDVDLNSLSIKQENDNESDTDDDCGSDTIQFTIKGSTYGENFQDNLKQYMYKQASTVMQLSFEFEPHNIVDNNAILISVCVSDQDVKPIGYVPGPRICQLRKAMVENVLLESSMKVTRKYVPQAGKNVYKGDITVTSSKKFIDLDKNYVYNAIM